ITSFTLIELLVVIAIIAVLTGLSLVVMRKSKNVSQIQKIKADMEKITIAAEMYKNKYGQYPGDAGEGLPFFTHTGDPIDNRYKEFIPDWPKSPCSPDIEYDWEDWPSGHPWWDWVPIRRVSLRRKSDDTAIYYHCLESGPNGLCRCTTPPDPGQIYCMAYDSIENAPKDFTCEDLKDTIKFPTLF
ncbi:MAG: prepilin-type N-terminal cleavage/methylation domain-containing protein, partial [Candidatus Berkelbacteria bacterium]|nr:prepilin-type N-terminal cleavage/methylation domain-containing protein [Candidatus Berkelbacteria bacterium]